MKTLGPTGINTGTHRFSWNHETLRHTSDAVSTLLLLISHRQEFTYSRMRRNEQVDPGSWNVLFGSLLLNTRIHLRRPHRLVVISMVARAPGAFLVVVGRINTGEMSAAAIRHHTRLSQYLALQRRVPPRPSPTIRCPSDSSKISHIQST